MPQVQGQRIPWLLSSPPSLPSSAASHRPDPEGSRKPGKWGNAASIALLNRVGEGQGLGIKRSLGPSCHHTLAIKNSKPLGARQE